MRQTKNTLNSKAEYIVNILLINIPEFSLTDGVNFAIVQKRVNKIIEGKFLEFNYCETENCPNLLLFRS